MGLIHKGIPQEELLFLKEILSLNTFVEGGTYIGSTAKEMSEIFKIVYTIEKSNVMYNLAKKNLKDIINIKVLHGDTRDYFESIIKSNDDVLFWLDAHWSEGETYGDGDECPLIQELQLIFKYDKNFLILIDDARLFLAPPPKNHNFMQWPSIKDIVKNIPDDYELIEFEDIIYIYHKKINTDFKSFMQNKATDKWQEYISNKSRN
jgi:hemerythrin superfamily protein